ncbi:hypothetical protein SprV_0401556800 [Sparganum proliferum]
MDDLVHCSASVKWRRCEVARSNSHSAFAELGIQGIFLQRDSKVHGPGGCVASADKLFNLVSRCAGSHLRSPCCQGEGGDNVVIGAVSTLSDTDEQKALRELKAETEIVILPADKCRSTVILDKVDYRNKALMLLNDRESYMVSDATSLKSLLAKVNKILSRLKKEKVITVKEWYMAKPTETPMARFYDLPKGLAVETLSDLLRQNYDEGDGQPTAQDLIELMGHCLKTFFTFEGITHEQIKGTPMGSPISGLIAEAVLQKLEKRLFGEYKPKFWARYVDDTFVIIDQDKITYYEELLNSINPDLQFTMEEEVESKLSFLDVLICRQPDGKLATSVYRKPTNTLRMLSYNSNHPL